jgi:REP element-mobilizing transposase RayT
VHHVFARGNNREAVFHDDADRREYLSRLARVVSSHGWRCLTFCLMDNHVHLLLETPEANLGRGMQALHGRYAQTFNARHGRDGHVFKGRFGSVLVGTDEQLWTTAAYIALNPVSAGRCDRPEQWRWSAHAALVGLAPRPDLLDVPRLLELFSGGGDGRVAYRRFVAGRQDEAIRIS